MKNILFILSLSILSIKETSSKSFAVSICDSTGGKKYHLTKNCRGLSNCKHEIIKTSLKKALTLGKTLCGFED